MRAKYIHTVFVLTALVFSGGGGVFGLDNSQSTAELISSPSRPLMSETLASFIRKFTIIATSLPGARVVNNSRVNNILRLSISPSITISGFADSNTGKLITLSITYDSAKALSPNELKLFVPCLSSIFGMLDPAVGSRQNSLLSQLGLSGQLEAEPVITSRAEQNGLRYSLLASQTGRMILRINPQKLRNSGTLAPSRQVNTQTGSSSELATELPTGNVANNVDDFGAKTAQETDTTNNNVLPAAIPMPSKPVRSVRPPHSVANQRIPHISRIPSIPGLGSIPYAGAANSLLNSLSRSSRTARTGSPPTNYGSSKTVNVQENLPTKSDVSLSSALPEEVAPSAVKSEGHAHIPVSDNNKIRSAPITQSSEGPEAVSAGSLISNPNSSNLFVRYLTKLRSQSFFEVANAYMQAPYRSPEELCAHNVLHEKIPKQSTDDILGIALRLEPAEGLYTILSNYLIYERHVDPMDKIATSELFAYLEAPKDGYGGRLNMQLTKRIPKLTDIEIGRLLDVLPPFSRSRYLLTAEAEKRGLKLSP